MNVILKRNIVSPPLNATAQKQCAALGLMCPTLRKKLSKRASELASKLPSKLPSMQPSELATELATERTSEQGKRAGWRCWALRRGIRGGFRRLLHCRLRRLRLVPLRALAGSWSCRIPVLRCWRRGRSPERRRRLSFQ